MNRRIARLFVSFAFVLVALFLITITPSQVNASETQTLTETQTIEFDKANPKNLYYTVVTPVTELLDPNGEVVPAILYSVEGETLQLFQSVLLTYPVGIHTFTVVSGDIQEEISVSVIDSSLLVTQIDRHNPDDLIYFVDIPVTEIIDETGTAIDPVSYVIGDNSVTILPSYLSTLSEGEHTLTVILSDTQEEIVFTVIDSSITVRQYDKINPESLNYYVEAPVTEVLDNDGNPLLPILYKTDGNILTIFQSYLLSYPEGEYTFTVISGDVEKEIHFYVIDSSVTFREFDKGISENLLFYVETPVTEILDAEGNPILPILYKTDGNVLTLFQSYLLTYPVGEHTFTVISGDVQREIKINVIDSRLEVTQFDKARPDDLLFFVDTPVAEVIDENGNALISILYRIEGNQLTIFESYVLTHSVGEYTFTVISDDSEKEITFTVVDTRPTVSGYESDYEQSLQIGLDLIVNLKGSPFVNIKNGITPLQSSDYTLDGNTLHIHSEYLSTLETGRNTFTLQTENGSTTFNVNIVSGPEPVLNSNQVFDLLTADDLVYPLNIATDTINSITLNDTVIAEENYTLSDNFLTMSVDYLLSLNAGDYTFIINTTNGDFTFNVTVLDYTPEISGGTSVEYDKAAPSDITFTIDTKEVTINTITINGLALASDNYIFENNELVIKQAYLETLEEGNLSIIVSTDGGDVSANVNVVDSTVVTTTTEEITTTADDTVEEESSMSSLFYIIPMTLIIAVGAGTIIYKRK